jgi:hypothetical protein
LPRAGFLARAGFFTFLIFFRVRFLGDMPKVYHLRIRPTIFRIARLVSSFGQRLDLTHSLTYGAFRSITNQGISVGKPITLQEAILYLADFEICRA